MIEELVPCDHCGGTPRIGRSQRVVARLGEPNFDYSVFGGDSGPPRDGDMMARPPGAPQTEHIVSIHCSDCGMSTPWEPTGRDEFAALTRCGIVWNRRLNRPETTFEDIRSLINREIGAPDAPFVLSLLARSNRDWEERGPLLAALAQRVIDATAVCRDYWPINPTLEDAARFRKLTQLANFITVAGHPTIHFPPIISPLEHRDMVFEDRIAAAVDALPDRERW